MEIFLCSARVVLLVVLVASLLAMLNYVTEYRPVRRTQEIYAMDSHLYNNTRINTITKVRKKLFISIISALVSFYGLSFLVGQ